MMRDEKDADNSLSLKDDKGTARKKKKRLKYDSRHMRLKSPLWDKFFHCILY